MKYITKKTTFLLAISLLAIPTTAIFIQELCDYDTSNWCRDNWSLLGDVGKATFWPTILFFFTYILAVPFQIKIFENWKRFAFFSTPIMIIATYLIINMPDSGGAWGGPSIHLGTLLLPLLYGLFFLTSIIIIGVSALRSRNKS